ncbi:acyltransferase domain-containing protein [Streptosporangium sp. NPDC023615]|uniref:acyltransferase domain-containing protein n=1 Tax=Streptosporangium sp. NPDC023615 TaxID=3154794 RepID=UPI00343C3F5F
MKTAALFPGQGAFDGKALLAAAERHPDIGDVFAEIDAVTAAEAGRKLSAIVLSDEPATMSELLADDPWVSQLAIYGVDVAVHRVLERAGWRPDVLAGHSLGEIAALVCAGAYTVADGARVIWERVRAVEGLELRGGYMAALSTGAERAGLIAALVADGSLAVAAENHPTQTVLSGSAAAMDIVREVAGAVKVPSARLAAGVPFHCPLLEPAVARFAAAVRAIPIRAPHTPVYSPIYGRYYEPGEDMGAALAGHFVERVRFADAVRALHADGVRVFVECGALETVSKLVRRNLDGADFAAVPGLTDAGRPIEDAVSRLRDLGAIEAAPAVPEGLLPGVDAEAFALFWADRGGAIVERIRREFAEYGTPAPATAPAAVPAASVTAPAAVPASVTAPVTAPVTASVTAPAGDLGDDLRRLYADALEYPVEVFTDDVLLEAELGIDSVKQVELLTRVSERYGLPARSGSFRLDEVATMDKVIGYVRATLGEHGAAGR